MSPILGAAADGVAKFSAVLCPWPNEGQQAYRSLVTTAMSVPPSVPLRLQGGSSFCKSDMRGREMEPWNQRGTRPLPLVTSVCSSHSSIGHARDHLPCDHGRQEHFQPSHGAHEHIPRGHDACNHPVLCDHLLQQNVAWYPHLPFPAYFGLIFTSSF